MKVSDFDSVIRNTPKYTAVFRIVGKLPSWVKGEGIRVGFLAIKPPNWWAIYIIDNNGKGMGNVAIPKKNLKFERYARYVEHPLGNNVFELLD